jgi:hypothetical protein
VFIQALCEQFQFNPRGDLLSASSSRWPQIRGGADACFKSGSAAALLATFFNWILVISCFLQKFKSGPGEN